MVNTNTTSQNQHTYMCEYKVLVRFIDNTGLPAWYELQRSEELKNWNVWQHE